MGSTLEDYIKECVTQISALEQIFILLKKDVFAISFSLLRDYSLAEDAMQETFIRLPKAAIKFKSNSGGKTFVLTISRNIALEFYRKKIKNSSDDNIDDIENEYIDYTQSVYLDQLLEKLNRKQAEVLSLHIFSCMKFEDIAKITHTPCSTLKSRYKKAIEIIKPYIE